MIADKHHYTYQYSVMEHDSSIAPPEEAVAAALRACQLHFSRLYHGKHAGSRDITRLRDSGRGGEFYRRAFYH